MNSKYNVNNNLKAECSFTTMPEQFQKPRLLLVEDHPMLQKIHSTFLQDMGFEVFVAASGQEALAAASNHFHLVLMDIGLPDISGVEVTQCLRTKNHFKHVPIIALTSYPKEMISEACVAAGINAIASKPLPISDLKSLVQHWLVFNWKNLN